MPHADLPSLKGQLYVALPPGRVLLPAGRARAGLGTQRTGQQRAAGSWLERSNPLCDSLSLRPPTASDAGGLVLQAS